MKLGFTSPHGTYDSQGDPKCMFFTLDTYQETFVSYILSDCRNFKVGWNGTDNRCCKNGQTRRLK